MSESLKEIVQQKLEQRMNSEGSPFRSSNLGQEFQKQNEGISINEGGSGSPNVKSSLGNRKAASRITSHFPPTSIPGAQASIKAKL